MQRGHARASSDPKKQELLAALMTTNERGIPSGPGSPQVSLHRHHHHHPEPDHAPSRPHRFSPEGGIQAETGERGGERGDARAPGRGGDPSLSPSAYRGGKVGVAPQGKSSLASVSYDSQPRPVGVASTAGAEEGDGKEAIPVNHVALRVAQFSVGEGEKEDHVRSPELEKARVLSSGSSEEELTSINSEGGVAEVGVVEGAEEPDGGYYHQKGEGLGPPTEGHTHPQLSQPTYLNRAHPSLQGPLPHNASSFPSLSQPHPSLSYETTSHHRAPHPHQKHHPHTTHHRTAPPNPHPPSQREYHQRSHDHHMTGYTGSHDHHMTGYLVSYDHHMSPHHVTSQHRGGHRGHAHSQASHTHQRLPISKQNLIKAHEAAANGDLTTLVGTVPVFLYCKLLCVSVFST